jgi:hypothetical protein
MRIFKLVITLLKLNIQQDLAYRADTLVSLLMNLMWMGWEVLACRSSLAIRPRWAVGR